MDFMHYDLGDLPAGQFVEVTLHGNYANVRLLNDEGFQSYKFGDSYYFVGGQARVSPVYLSVPKAGHWHLAVDVEGLNGSVTSAVRLLRMPPPSMQNLMSSVLYYEGGVVQPVDESPAPLKGRYDMFICYVTEDRNDVARPLAAALTQRGLRVGTDDFEIKDGTSPIDVLDNAMENCSCGIFIVSQSMLGKPWSGYEWESTAGKVVRGSKPVFAIWHNVEARDVKPYSKSLAEKPARWTGLNTLENIAAEIADIIGV